MARIRIFTGKGGVGKTSVAAASALKLAAEGQTGARSVFDVPPAYLSPRTGAELRRTLL